MSFIQVKFDAKGTLKDLNIIEKSQFPFAYTKALTTAAKGSAFMVKQRTRQLFKLHGKFIPNNIKITPALKKDFIRFGSAFSEVYADTKISFMGLHEKGGIKKPRGKMLSLPAIELQAENFRTKTGKVKEIWKPKTLLNRYRAGRLTKKNTKSKKQLPFIQTTRKGAVMLMRRVSKNKYPIDRLYLFTQKAKIKPKWGFETTVRRFVNKNFNRIFEKSFADALRTAK